MKISTQNFRLFTPEKCQRMAETHLIMDLPTVSEQAEKCNVIRL